MILIGQYDSPFTRRVGIALTLYGLAFEHRPWSTFGDAEKIRPYNPLVRVPTLVLDDGEVLVESHGILDYLDFASPVSGLGSKMGIDATNKWPGETTREWGTPIVMDANVKARVDALWQDLGL